MLIRRAEKKDVERIVEMGSRSLREGPYGKYIQDRPGVTKSLAEDLLFKKSATIIVAEEDDRVCGILCFVTFPHYFSGRPTAGELIWYVEPEHRAGGTAIDLLRAALKTAKDKGAETFQLTAPLAKIGEMYKRCGFYEIETTYVKEL